ncbi:hypothetical protein [Bacillus mycoides]|uniref:hypothetical protein n=1 Tax=Bacillus mycoides TaxID=1405 RepID=UPI003A7FDFCF
MELREQLLELTGRLEAVANELDSLNVNTHESGSDEDKKLEAIYINLRDQKQKLEDFAEGL